MHSFGPRFACLMALGLLLGCGGGGGKGGSSSAPVVLATNVKQLPSDGTVTISDVTDSSVTLSGAVPTLAVGDVILSKQGQGLMRKVVSVSASGGSTTLQTTDAAMADAIQSGDVKLKTPISLDAFDTWKPTLAGVTVKSSRSAPSSRSLGASKTLYFNDTKVEGLPGTDGKTHSITLNGTVTFSLGLDASASFSILGLKSAEFVPELQIDSDLTIDFEEGLLPEIEVPIGEPVVLGFYDFGPVVLTPVFYPKLSLEVNAKVGLSIESKTHVHTTSGLRFSRGDGWVPVVSLDKTASAVPKGTGVSTGLSATFTPFNPELACYIDLVKGPYLEAALPSITFDIDRVVTAPTGIDISLKGEASATAGVQVKVLDRSLVDFSKKVLDTGFDILSLKIPDTSGVTVGVK